MRTLRFLALAAVAAATLAALPSTAAGQLEVLSEEAGGNTHCGVIAECAVEVHGETMDFFSSHLITGAEIAGMVCQSEWTLTLDEDGGGSITNQLLAGSGCLRKPCGATNSASGDGDPWPADLREANGELSLHYTFCLENADGAGGEAQCEISLHVDDLGQHFYEFTANDERCAGAILPPGVTGAEVDGHWITESDAIEVVH